VALSSAKFNSIVATLLGTPDQDAIVVTARRILDR
jgi:hypothetical protein